MKVASFYQPLEATRCQATKRPDARNTKVVKACKWTDIARFTLLDSLNIGLSTPGPNSAHTVPM